MALFPSRMEPVFLVRGACGQLISCALEQWQMMPCKIACAALQNHGDGVSARAAHDVDMAALTALETASTASGKSDDGGGADGSSAGQGTDWSEDGPASGSGGVTGSNKTKGPGKSRRHGQDELWQQRQRLEELGLQRPLLIGPLREFTDDLVQEVVRRFGGLVQTAQVMQSARSRSTRCSLMLWLPDRVSVSIVEEVGGSSWPVVVEDPTGGRVVVECLQDLFPAGVEQADKLVGVQQATKHFAPGLGAFNPGDR